MWHIGNATKAVVPCCSQIQGLSWPSPFLELWVFGCLHPRYKASSPSSSFPFGRGIGIVTVPCAVTRNPLDFLSRTRKRQHLSHLSGNMLNTCLRAARRLWQVA